MEFIYLTIAAAFLFFYLAFGLSRAGNESGDEKIKHTVLIVLALFFGVYMLVIMARNGIDVARNCQLLMVSDSENYVYGSNFTDSAGSEHWHDGSALYVYSATDNTPRIHLFNHNTTYYYAEVCQDNASQISTAQTFYKITLWFFRLIIIYLIGFLVWFAGEWLKRVRGGNNG